MDKFLKQKREHDDSGSRKHNESSSNKRVKTRSICKYNERYLAFDFHWTENIDEPLPLCVVCAYKMANESLVPSTLTKHFKTRHSHLQGKSVNYFKRLLEQQTKAGNSFKSRVIISEKSQIASYEVSELIAQNMKAHTLGESLILPECKKIVKRLLGNEAAKEISKVSLSNDTVHRRILEMLTNFEKTVCSNKLQFSDFALQVDESTDNANKAQL